MRKIVCVECLKAVQIIDSLLDVLYITYAPIYPSICPLSSVFINLTIRFAGQLGCFRLVLSRIVFSDLWFGIMPSACIENYYKKQPRELWFTLFIPCFNILENQSLYCTREFMRTRGRKSLLGISNVFPSLTWWIAWLMMFPSVHWSLGSSE